MKTIVTFGTYDLLHVGHIRLLSRAKELGGRLIVGVSSDSLNFSKKNKYPEFSQQERMEIISMIKKYKLIKFGNNIIIRFEKCSRHKTWVWINSD